jgi:isocitrate/isopropylmalate dehydrogenase
MTARGHAAIDILVLEGDGIGPEITAATLAVLRAADAKFGLRLVFDAAAIGWAAHRSDGTTLPQSALEKATAAHGVLLGPGVAQRLSASGQGRPQSVR